MSGLDPSHIMQVGMGFFASKTLLSAVELELFTTLARQPMTGKEIAAALQLHPRAIPDLPDALVALNFLQRDGDGPEARYANTPERWRMLVCTDSGRISPRLSRRACRKTKPNTPESRCLRSFTRTPHASSSS